MLVDGVLRYNTPLLLVQSEDNSVRGSINNRTLSTQGMPKGLKETSSVVSIGFSAVESAANTFTQTQVDLNLSPLDREVFVVLAINIDSDFPDNLTNSACGVRSFVSSTSQTNIPSLADANCLSRLSYQAKNVADTCVSTFGSQSLETPPSTLEYIGIIATNDFFVGIKGDNNAGIKGMAGKMYGYRARADADIYAALVQSEVLSS